MVGMTTRTRSYEHLRGQHPAVVYELVHQVELELDDQRELPADAAERAKYFAELDRRQDEASTARRGGTDAMIELLNTWNARYGR